MTKRRRTTISGWWEWCSGDSASLMRVGDELGGGLGLARGGLRKVAAAAGRPRGGVCPLRGLVRVGGLSCAGCGLVPPGCPGPVKEDCRGGGEDCGDGRDERDLPAGHAAGDVGL